ncbi:MAG: murein biosynthesis integral membrane protein MurJ [Pseudobdellovibrionaceae bacterium]
MKLVKAMATVAGLTFTSRIAGFVRDMATAAMIGAGPVSDAFFVALKLPNFFRRVTAEGAFNVSFVPLYTKTLEEDGEEAAGRFASNAYSLMIVVLGIFSILMMIAMPLVVELIAPGFQDDPERYPLAIAMSRITFPYLLLISLTALLGGVLNAHHRFAPFAAAPIIFNLTIVAALFGLTPFVPTAGHAMAWGVSISGGLQLLMLAFFVKRHKIIVRFKKPEITVRIKRLFKLMGPGIVGAGVMHINLFADMIIASLLPTGAISYMYYADRLNQLPLGVVGIAIGTALLPMLTKALVAGEAREAKDLYNRALEYSYLLALPAATALLIIPHSLIQVLFERGEFGPEDTQATAMVLGAYAIGLPAYIASKVYASAFWAKQDTLTPVKISIFITLLNIALAYTLSRFIGVAGIALGTSIVGWLQIIIYNVRLRGMEHATHDSRFKMNMMKIVGATALMGGLLYILNPHVQPLLDGSVLSKIGGLAILVAAGASLYGVIILFTGVIVRADLRKYLKRKKKK